MSLPATGLITYQHNAGTFTFGPETRILSVSVTPQLDSAGRVVVYNKFALSIETTLIAAANNTIEATCLTARRILTQPGGYLHVEDKGFGGLTISNAVGAAKDAVWGPKCTALKIDKLRNNLAATLLWNVEVAMPDCSGASYTFAPMEFCYTVQFAIDRSGLTTRTYNGHLAIPQTRLNYTSRTPSDDVDNYWSRIYAQCPLGFRRESATRTVSEDKSKLTFAITDVELPSRQPPPPGVVEVASSHRARTGKRASLNYWTGSITARYELTKDTQRSTAFRYFLAFAGDRLGAMDKMAQQQTIDKVAMPQKRGKLIVTSLSIEEPEIHGKIGAAFSCEYVMTGDLSACLAGFWRKVPFSDNETWRTSLLGTVLHPRGAARFRDNPDALVDLCSGQQPVLPTPTPPPTSLGGQDPDPFTPTCPPPESSWLLYELSMRVEGDSGVVTQRPLPTRRLKGQFGNPEAGLTPSTLKAAPLEPLPDLSAGIAELEQNIQRIRRQKANEIVNPQVPAPPPDAGPIYQQRVAQDCEVVLIGRAARVCYSIPSPNLSSVGGQTVQAANDPAKGDFFDQWIAGNSGLPVYCAEWQLRWKVSGGSTVGPPANPIDGQQTRSLKATINPESNQ
jgi:hypothetical protein